MTVCLVTARSGSKRIPAKNIKVFAGIKPIIQLAIESLLASGITDEVLVDTDSPEIAGVASDAGASIPYLRDPALATDEVTTCEVISSAIDRLGLRPEEDLLVAYPTNLMPPWLYEEAQAKYTHRSADFLVSMAIASSDAEKLLYGRVGEPTRVLDRDAITGEKKIKGNLYYDAGKFYWGKCNAWLSTSNPLLSAEPFLVSGLNAIDINTYDDWAQAEELFIRDSWLP